MFHIFPSLGRVTVKSCLVRTFLVLFIHGLAQGIPHFGLFLNLVGSSTTTLLTFVFPCLFFLKLERNASLHMKVFLYEIIVVGLVAAVTSTYFAMKAIIEELSS
jgi:vesicular inhibitory amino acid transporter